VREEKCTLIGTRVVLLVLLLEWL